MMMLDSWMNSKILHFPVKYNVYLPDATAEGEAFPLALLLHDLGHGREQFMFQARLEKLVEHYQVGLVVPEGRRSCFLNMAHGPQWADWLGAELIPWLQQTVCVGECVGVIGVGSGGLGALSLVQLHAVLIDPDLQASKKWDPQRWPHKKEWLGVFEGKPDADASSADIICGGADDLEDKLNQALSVCLERYKKAGVS